MVGKHDLGCQMVYALSVPGQKREQIQSECAVPVKEFSIGLVLFEFHQLHRIAAYHLSLEIIVARRILRIHDRSGGIGFERVAEHTPVGIVAVDDSRRYVHGYSEQAAFGRVRDRCAGTVLLAVRAQVYAVGIAVVGAHAVVALFVAAADGKCVLHGEACAGHGIEPVIVALEIHTAVAPAKTYFAIVLGAHHVKFFFRHVPGECAGVSGVGLSVFAPLFGRDQNHTVGASCAVYGRCGTVFEDIERRDVVGIDIGQVAARHTVYDDQRAEAG